MKGNKFNIIVRAVTAVIFVVGLALSMIVISKGDPRSVDADQLGVIEWNKLVDAHEAKNGKDAPFTHDKTPQELGQEKFDEIERNIVGTVSTTIDFTMIVLWACVIISLLSFLIALVTDFKRFMPFIIGTVALLIIIGISYALSSDIVPSDLTNKSNASTYRLVGTGVLTSFILTALAGLGWVAGEVLKLVK